jgi:hypothetical protein
MKKYLLSILFFISCSVTIALGQKVIKTEIINSNNAISDLPLQVTYLKCNDTCFQKSIYKVKGMCCEISSYKSKDFTTLHGRYCSYAADGWLDTCGIYLNGIKEGYWFRRIIDSEYQTEVYQDGILMQIDDTFYVRADQSMEEIFNENSTATFPGGANAWQKYLIKKLAPSGIGDNESGHDIVAFTIDKTGNVNDIFMWLTKDNFSDNIAKKVFASMPRWHPAKDKVTGLSKDMFFQQPIIWIQAQ